MENRAWITVDCKAIQHNIYAFQSILPTNTKIMAVVKADAYGHGAIEVSKSLNKIGIDNFAVATLQEAIELRKNNIQGNILILGYTPIQDLDIVRQYNLMITIVDASYASTIHKPIKCHVKINTGMNRLGTRYDDYKALDCIYTNPNLDIQGTYSHFCVADSSMQEDINFTNLQVQRFEQCITYLKQTGYTTGKLHLQSSYGVINYNHLHYDYVRIGICMYGVQSTYDSYQKIRLPLKPALSLHAWITSIKQIEQGESVSYGRTFIASKRMKVASVSIGYADGLDRSISNQNMLVKVNGMYCRVIGRVCMDQCVIDVSEVEDVCVGDVVDFIDAHDNVVNAQQFAYCANTITNEILTRFKRMKIVYL